MIEITSNVIIVVVVVVDFLCVLAVETAGYIFTFADVLST